MADTLQENNYRTGLNIVREQARRNSSADASADQEGDDGLEAQEAQSQNFFRRRLSMLKNLAREKKGATNPGVLQQEAEAKIKKEIARKASWRTVNLVMGSTLILVFLTVLVWTVQFIGGNILGSKVIPKLGIGEIVMWLLAMTIVSTFFYIIMFFIGIISYAYEHPLQALVEMNGFFRSVIWEIFKGFFRS